MFINPFRIFTRPEYLFRPTQVVHRFRRLLLPTPAGDIVNVVLPWGGNLNIHPQECIGAGIWCYGVFDLIVAEAIARLLDPTEVALDIGANIGQMTSLMRHRAGSLGRVLAFEPHPTVFAELKVNVHSEGSNGLAPATLFNYALSEINGTANLDIGEGWDGNRGLARIVDAGASLSHRTLQIQIKRLDSEIPAHTKIGVCKIDVEGHELKVLNGAQRLLIDRCIRDVIFEDLEGPSSPVYHHLVQAGFTLFCLHLSLFGPSIHPATQTDELSQATKDGNYLATLDPKRALGRFSRRGWLSLKRG